MSRRDLGAAERQASLTESRRRAGFKRISIWVPGDVHEHVVNEANARGISMQDRIIQKLRA